MANIKFDQSWKKAVAEIQVKNTNKVKSAALMLCKYIIKDTPVLTGHLKGNWQSTIGRPGSRDIDRQDPDGSLAAHELSKQIRAWNVYKNSFYLSNSADYAELIEYGYSRLKAPYGMVRINVINWPSILKYVNAKTGRK